MGNMVFTEINLPVRIFRSSLLKYFSEGEITFLVTNLVYDNPTHSLINDKLIAEKMIRQGILKVENLNEEQMNNLDDLYNNYKSKFRVKTISSLILARDNKLKLISEDELIREVASNDFNIRAFDKEWLLLDIITEISLITGIKLDIDLIRDIV